MKVNLNDKQIVRRMVKNRFLIFVISLFILLFLPCVVNAQTKESDYIPIDVISEIELNSDVKVKSITFKDNSNNSSLSFGMVASVYNNSSFDYNLNSTIYYYDKSYTLLATSNYNHEISANKYADLVQMLNINKIKGGYSVDDIYYYKILFDYHEDNFSNSSQSIYNTPSLNELYDVYDYVIDSYNVNIIVNENNTFDITETITANFYIPKHGIFRKIPLVNTIKRLDGTTSKNRARLTNLQVNEKYTTSKGSNYYQIQIGDANKTITGTKKYVISYNYNIGQDPNKNYDEFYFNIIGNEWDTVIGNVTFTITMPKDFDESKMGFSSGKIGSTNNSNIKYSVTDNTITGRYDGILNKNEALTVRMELDEGYFVGAGYPIGVDTYLYFIIPILSLIVSLVLWYKFGRDDHVIETVEFYPPEGINSLDLGFLYKGRADKEDVISLLIYLANKGYIKIVEDNSNISSNKFKIVKLKDYDGNDTNEQLFLEGLFWKSNISIINKKFYNIPISDNIEVTSNDLYNSFYQTLDLILLKTNSKFNKRKIFENTSKKKFIIVLLIILSLITMISVPTLQYAGVSDLGPSLAVALFLAPFYAVVLADSIPGFFKIIWLVFTVILSSLFIRALPLVDIIKNDKVLFIGFIIGMICLIGTVILLKLMTKRTEYGNTMLGKIKGFKTFLETAEKERLEALVMQDPSYFYNILPYTYALRISKKWVQKFEQISLQAPNWYDSPNTFTHHSFDRFMSNTMSSARKSMSSRPTSSSGGSSGGSSSSSSGGGSSGGGSGGGGGGSW